MAGTRNFRSISSAIAPLSGTQPAVRVQPTSWSDPTVPIDGVVATLTAAGFELGPSATVERLVLDTFDGRLHAAGLQLELDGGGDPTLVLRSVAAESAVPEARMAWPDPAPSWPDALTPGPFRARIATVTKERALVPMLGYRARARLARRVDKRGKAVVAVELLDRIEGPSGSPAWIATLAPVAGHAGAAAETVDLLARLGVTPVARSAAALVAGAATLGGYTSSPTVDMAPGVEAGTAFHRVLANLLATIEVNLPGTVADTDPEFLHELRVAVRRSRSVLGQAKGSVADDVRIRAADGFRWLGQITTDPRDLDVYLLGWQDYVAPLPPNDAARLEPVRAELERRRVLAHDVLAAELVSERARTFLGWWHGVVAAPPTPPVVVAAPPLRVPIGPVVAERIAKLDRVLRRDGRAIAADTPAERLHDLRKDAKKLRYLLECFGGLLPIKPRKAFVSQLKVLQDNLGEHQDAEVHVDQLRQLAADLHGTPGVGPDTLLAMGRLSDHLDRRRQAARDEFAARFAAYDTKDNRQALAAMLAPLQHPALPGVAR